MKGALMSVSDKLLLRKRAIIETVNDELKNIAQVEHSRHRSFGNFVVNLLGGIAACHPLLFKNFFKTIPHTSQAPSIKLIYNNLQCDVSVRFKSGHLTLYLPVNQ